MSWHHEDYISLISSVGGLGSAFFAAYATYQARKSTDISRLALERSERQSEFNRISDELVRLSERCNKCIGQDAHVIPEIKMVYEVATCCFYAENAIKSSSLTQDDKNILTRFFTRNILPGVVGEIEHAYALKEVGMSPCEKDLRDIYRSAQVFLNVDEPEPIP